MTERAMTERPAARRAAGSSSVRRAPASAPLGRLRAAVYDGVRFLGMVVLGMLGVWALVLLFG